MILIVQNKKSAGNNFLCGWCVDIVGEEAHLDALGDALEGASMCTFVIL